MAVAATWHTLTRLLLQLVYTVREACPEGRLLQPWERMDEDTASEKDSPTPDSLTLRHCRSMKQPSGMIMQLSDGCIEDMGSLLFTSVVSNLSVIVGYDIDGKPINESKPLTALQRMAGILDPYGLTGIGGNACLLTLLHNLTSHLSTRSPHPLRHHPFSPWTTTLPPLSPISGACGPVCARPAGG